MNLPVTIRGSKQEFSESQKAALISLLADEDPAVYQVIREKLIAGGPAVVDWLRPHLLSSDPATRRRVTELVNYFLRHQADNDFLAFCLCQGEEFDVEEGAWLLARTQYPTINIGAYRALLDSFAGDLRDRVDPSAPHEESLSTINEYLFLTLGFSGNEVQRVSPHF